MSATAPKANGRPARVSVARVPETVGQPEGAQLAAAVLEVQAAAPKLLRNQDGQVGPRTYRYADLTNVTDVVLPLLVEHELLWRTFPTALDGQPALRYTMTHVPSGEFDEDTMLLMVAKPGAQEQGSGITYARRYALCAYLGLTVDQDDDGAAASQPGGTTSQPSAAAPQQSEKPASAAQRKMLRAKTRDARLDVGDFANVLKASWGDEPVQWPDPAAAERFVDRALDRLPARLVNAVVAGIEGSRS